MKKKCIKCVSDGNKERRRRGSLFVYLQKKVALGDPMFSLWSCEAHIKRMCEAHI